MVKLLDSFVSTLIKDALLTLTDMNPEKEEAPYDRAVMIQWSLLLLPRSNEKLEIQVFVVRKLTIMESRKLL